ncbi:MAG: type II toxin-antitoxin system RelE/ParE family toxin [Hyphomicrobiales bacterium]|jgi:toxin ParE1/3/4
MTLRRWRYTTAASADIERITEDTLERFGEQQARRYAQMIDRAVDLVADDPERPAARRHAELGQGVRSLHVAFAGPRAGAASHIVFYRTEQRDRGQAVVVLRVLHERMDPALHLEDEHDRP